MTGDIHQNGEPQMSLEPQTFPESSVTALEDFERLKRGAGLALRKAGERAEIAIPLE